MPIIPLKSYLGFALVFCLIAISTYYIIGAPFYLLSSRDLFFAIGDNSLSKIAIWKLDAFSAMKLTLAALTISLFYLSCLATFITAIVLCYGEVEGGVARKIVVVAALCLFAVIVGVFDFRPKLGIAVYLHSTDKLHEILLTFTDRRRYFAMLALDKPVQVHFCALLTAVATIGVLSARPALRIWRQASTEANFDFPGKSRVMLLLSSAVTSTFIASVTVFQELYKNFTGVDQQTQTNLTSQIKYMNISQTIQATIIFTVPIVVVAIGVVIICERALKLYPEDSVKSREILQSALAPIYFVVVVKIIILSLEYFIH